MDTIQIDIDITDVSKELEGIGVHDGRQYKVRYTNVGDKARLEVKPKRKKSYYVLDKFFCPENLDRPKCKHFKSCGGCAAQHIDYSLQFQYKTNSIAQEFLEKFQISVDLSLATSIYHYRSRMDFAVFPEKIGLHASKRFNQIVDIDYCYLQSDWANQELSSLRDLVQKHPDIAYNRDTGQGFLKYITLRKAQFTDSSISIFTFTTEYENSLDKNLFIEEVLKHSNAENIVFCYNNKKSEVSAQGKPEIIKGVSYFIEEVLGHKIHINFNSFFQANPKAFYPILNFIQNKLNNLSNVRLIDFYSGVGFFSAVLGERFDELYGFDFVESSIQEANTNLKRLYPTKKIHFSVIDLVQLKNVENFVQINDKDSIAILDPPRAGLGRKLIEFLLCTNIQNIFYVSCNPETMLLDLKMLSPTYTIQNVLITDPFPHTSHLESVAHLMRVVK